MTVVVTGATGSMGTALLRKLDGDVVGLARRLPDENVEPYCRARWVRCDLGAPTSGALLRDVFAGATAVVHLAWAIQPGTDERPMEETNIAGSARVLHAAAEAGVPHVVCVSSVGAYAPGPRWRRVGEGWPVTGVPGSAYSSQKARLESMLDAFTVDHPEIAVARVRPCAVLQPGSAAELGRWSLGSLLPSRLLRRRWLPIPLWPGLRAQAVHADDVAAAITALLDRELAGCFNLAGASALDARQLARIFGGFLLPVPLPVLRAGAWLGWRTGLIPLHPGWLRLADQVPLMDTDHARQELDWHPVHDSHDTFELFVEGLSRGDATPSPPLDHGKSKFHLGRPTKQSQNRDA